MKNLKRLSENQIDELTSFISSLCLCYETYSHVSEFMPKSIYNSIINFHSKLISEINAIEKEKEPIIYAHNVFYYKKGVVVDSNVIADVVNPDLYWKNFISNYNPPCGFISIGKYKIVNSCVRAYDYCINELIIK